MIAAETANSITLKRAEGESDTVLRDQIDELVDTGMSIMPEGLEKQIDTQAMADLLDQLNRVTTNPLVRASLLHYRAEILGMELGDEEAADWLAQGRYCMSCGEPLTAKGRFCPKCGKDQTVEPKKKKTFKLKHRPRPGEDAPPGTAPPN